MTDISFKSFKCAYAKAGHGYGRIKRILLIMPNTSIINVGQSNQFNLFIRVPSLR